MEITNLVMPLSIQSKGGYAVKILAIDPKDHDCFSGEITLPNETKRGRWDLNGLMRGGADSTNLLMNSNVLALLGQFARQLGAK